MHVIVFNAFQTVVNLRLSVELPEHSPMAADFAIRHYFSGNFVFHGDCLSLVDHARMQGRLQNEPVPALLQSLTYTGQRLKSITYAHVQGHDYHPWNELADVIAKASAQLLVEPCSFSIIPQQMLVDKRAR